MTFATKRPARLFLPGAAPLLCPVPTSAAGRTQETAETCAIPVPKGSVDAFAPSSILKAEDVYGSSHGTGEPPRGREGSTRVNPTVPALQI